MSSLSCQGAKALVIEVNLLYAEAILLGIPLHFAKTVFAVLLFVFHLLTLLF